MYNLVYMLHTLIYSMHGLLFIVGRLTNVRIDKLQTYYGLAIRRNTGNLEGMRSEIMAGLVVVVYPLP